MKVALELRSVVPLALIFCWMASATAQSSNDTLKVRKGNRLDLFPAISYSPETKLTLGVIGIKYFDFTKGDPNTPLSQMEFLAVYTTAKQTLIESRWEVFTSQNKWRTRGEALFNHYTDRNYGIGNDADVLVRTIKGDQVDTVNYMLFNINRLKFSPSVLRKIGNGLYLGLQADIERMDDLELVPDWYRFLTDNYDRINMLPVEGLRVGGGLQALYDTRDYVANPLHGSLVELNLLHYYKWFGADFQFVRFQLDARHYINTTSNHTLALRGFLGMQGSDEPIPMRALSRTNGHKFIRGYFRGTYQDNDMAAFEVEYRMPFWQEGSDSKLWQVWKRLGMVAFLGGAQAFHTTDEFAFDRFNLAAGAGLRILFNKSSRVNVRIDYAIGLRKDSDGPGRRQRGLYFFLAEAF